MQILENVTPGKPVRTFTLCLDAREMDVLSRCLSYVEVPSVDQDIRTQFWDLYAKITLANNANDGA